ncbi:hypothetical protein [Christiangramia sp.]|uniref:hypothetical protein n=1 Tax=Christiangramia sp. TaxID=1931228 RepID=UPI00261BFB60|nr:hypothetical protein [Christiangramia sp.]
MITTKQKKYILKAIGSKHISKIKKWAKDNGVRKDDGTEFSASMFSMVLHWDNTGVSHKLVEDAIFGAAKFYLEKSKDEQQSRRDFIEEVKEAKL